MNRSGGFRAWRPHLFNGIPLIIYAVVTWGTMVQHEPWRGEAFAWLVARDTNLGQLFRVLALDWHPALWYLILMPLAHMGWPILAAGVLHWALAVGTAAMLLWKSPFSRLTRILILFSYYMFWEYCIIIRIYGPSIFLMFILAIQYNRRFSAPLRYGFLVALLANVNLHISFLSMGLLLAYALECVAARRWTPRHIGAIAIMTLGLVALFLTVGKVPSADDAHGVGIFGKLFWWEVVKAPGEAFFVGVLPVAVRAEGNAIMLPVFLAPAGFTILAAVGFVLLTRPAVLLVYLVFLALDGVVCLHMGGASRHHGLILMVSLFCLWIAHQEPEHRLAAVWSGLFRGRFPDFPWRWRTTMIMLNMALLISMPAGWHMHVRERLSQFSGSKEMARFIQSNRLTNYPIVAHKDAHTSTVLAYLPDTKFWYPVDRRWGTYVLQTPERRHRNETITVDEVVQMVHMQFLDSSPVLLLLSDPLPETFNNTYYPLYQVDRTVFGSDELLYLYAPR